MEFEGLTRLEDIVGRLLSQYTEYKQQNEMLAAEVAEKNQELLRLNDKISEMGKDKDEVHHRVSSILTKLDEWEQAGQGSDSVSQESTPGQSVSPDSQNKLFNMGV